MANIQITQLQVEEPTQKMIDLKAEAEKGNSAAITAFKSLRGGATVTWKCVQR